jgi:hypothetical protein
MVLRTWWLAILLSPKVDGILFPFQKKLVMRGTVMFHGALLGSRVKGAQATLQK